MRQERKPLFHTTAPYTGVVYVDSIGEDGSHYPGTGFLVSPNVVVTAAHVVTTKVATDVDLVSQVNVYPFYHSETEPIFNAIALAIVNAL